MRRIYNSVVGILLIIAAVTGLIVSIGGIIGIGAVHDRVDSAIKHQLALFDQALTATDQGLRTASTSVTQSKATLTSIKGTIDGSATAMDDIVPAVEAMGSVIGTQLPSTVEGATKALTTFASTAAVIDKVMGVVTALPFVSIPAYNPDVPLAESVTKFRDSIGDLGTKLQDIQGGLSKTAANLGTVRGEVQGVGTALGGLNDSLAGTVEVLASYQRIVADLRAQVDAATKGLEDALRWARIVATFALLWLGIASLGLLTLGLDLVQRNRAPRPLEVMPVEAA
jgi:hypothetical protein